MNIDELLQDLRVPEGLYWQVNETRQTIDGWGLRTSASRGFNMLQGFPAEEVVKELNSRSKAYNAYNSAKDLNLDPDTMSKIEMIQVIRSARGLGLKEAKEFVEELMEGGSPKLPFTPYSGVPELEGKGYFPFKETEAFPLEAAEIMGYEVADKAQDISGVQGWKVCLSTCTFCVHPIWANEELALGWNPKLKFVCGTKRGQSLPIFAEVSTYEEAEQMKEAFCKAFLAGREYMKKKVYETLAS